MVGFIVLMLVADFYFFFALRIVECLNGLGLHSFNLTMFVNLVEWPLGSVAAILPRNTWVAASGQKRALDAKLV